MKWYVLTLFLLVGFVWGVSAQQVDPGLVGDWETNDGPCSPCILTIQADGTVKFVQSGTPLTLIGYQITPEPGVNVVGPLGGKLDLSLTRASTMLVGYFTTYTEALRHQPVAFRRK
jgi:hypothetical protein